VNEKYRLQYKYESRIQNNYIFLLEQTNIFNNKMDVRTSE